MQSAPSPQPAAFSASFSTSALLEATSGTFLTTVSPSTPKSVTISTDTRTIGKGQWFLPLSGANFNGHNFVLQALAQGAEGAFVSKSEWEKHQPEWKDTPNLIGVENTLDAYLNLAKWHRLHSNPNLKVIALTGSSGKTTTKEMLFAAFNDIKKTQKTLKNFNNEVGVSQTLLAIESDTEISIVEMGMRGLHQIDILSEATLPDIALINNVGPAHIELLGSLENVANAKLEIIVGLNPDTGILVTNGDDPLLNEWTPKLWKPKNPEQWQTFNLKDAANIQATEEGGVLFRYQGHAVKLPIPGQHNVQNALAVLKVGECLGLPLETLIQGLANFQSEGGRWDLQPVANRKNLWSVNDAYNANPDSCKASLKTFYEIPFKGLQRILVLGGMKELGSFSEQYHQELGEWLIQEQEQSRHPLHILICVGDELSPLVPEFSDKMNAPVWHVASGTDIPELIQSKHLPLENALYLLKGSRAYQLEHVIQFLNADSANTALSK